MTQQPSNHKLIHSAKVSQESETQELGAELEGLFCRPAMVYLCGELGTGKTTLSKSIVAAAGYTESVTSPTYNLIHEYPLGPNSGTIFHLDLYRLNDPQELYFLGVEDLWASDALFLVEWPEKGQGILRDADYIVEITKNSAKTEDFREFSIYQTF